MVSSGFIRFCSLACCAIAAVRCVNAFIMPGSSLPVEGMTAEGLKNLIYLIHSKQYLINRAFAEEVFRIPAELVEALGSAEIPGSCRWCSSRSGSCR